MQWKKTQFYNQNTLEYLFKESPLIKDGVKCQIPVKRSTDIQTNQPTNHHHQQQTKTHKTKKPSCLQAQVLEPKRFLWSPIWTAKFMQTSVFS